MLTRYEEITSVIFCDDSYQKRSHPQIKRCLFFFFFQIICMCIECVDSAFCWPFSMLFPPLESHERTRCSLSCLFHLWYLYQQLVFCHVVTFWWISPHNVCIFFSQAAVSFSTRGRFWERFYEIITLPRTFAHFPCEFSFHETLLCVQFVEIWEWTYDFYWSHCQCCYLPVKLACITADGLS